MYPATAFDFLLAIGLLFTRYHRKRLNFPKSGYRAWDIAVCFAILSNLYLLVAPWYPPLGGATGGDVSFWYGTYLVVGIAIIGVCGVYYYVWIKILPKMGGYEFRQTILKMEGGATAHKLVKVPNDHLESWDAEHDAAGRLRHRGVRANSAELGKPV
ncbi:hypothetical protein EYZ11_010644 [Aspergillus tanneri]|nr:hypothetical protein EYZ11_010644 [Aspergillus tanneri]